MSAEFQRGFGMEQAITRMAVIILSGNSTGFVETGNYYAEKQTKCYILYMTWIRISLDIYIQPKQILSCHVKIGIIIFTNLYLYLSIIHIRKYQKKVIYITSVKKVVIISNNLIPKIKAPKPKDL